MALTTIFDETELSFAFNETMGAYAHYENGLTFIPAVGDTYIVKWDGVEYTCTVQDASAVEAGAVAMGDMSSYGGTGNGEPFVIGFFGTTLSMFAFDTQPTHTVGLYQETSTDEDDSGGDTGGTEEEQEGIILKDRNGNNVAYYGIETVTFDTTTEGKQQKYTKGVKVEKTVELSLADGDQTVEPDEGTLLSKVIIQRPDSLQPEIILSGHEVAGVPGAYVPITTEEKTVDLDFSEGDMTVEAESGKAFSKVRIPVPENLVPEILAEGMYVAGIGPGTHSGGGGGVTMEGDFRNYVLYQIDPEAMTMTIYKVWWAKLYSETGSYDLDIPSKCGDFDVVIYSEGV